ncbi:recombinase family protein [Halorubrum coriense]|uniref:recombinase family protein n=1 Tax=Halorubrum coriense TaxID=64713 RepID=UPI001EFA0271|nr:recombinase family protein [Halorubrum coriense]
MSENGPSNAAIYARVSASDQDISRHLDEAHEHLERLGVKDIEEYPEIVSGAADTDTRDTRRCLSPCYTHSDGTHGALSMAARA